MNRLNTPSVSACSVVRIVHLARRETPGAPPSLFLRNLKLESTQSQSYAGSRFAKAFSVVAVLLVIGAYFAFDLGRFLDLAWLKSRQADFQHYYKTEPLESLALYFGLYVTIASLSLPGAALLTVAAGAMFGFAVGVGVVSFASAIGATIAFLISRYLLRNVARKRFGESIEKFNRGVESGGAFYLFSLRLVPALPYFVTNLGMGLTNMRVSTYYWVSQLAMLAGTVVYVNAGTQLAEIDSLQSIMSPGMIASFVLLALFPLIGRFVVTMAGRHWSGKDPQRR